MANPFLSGPASYSHNPYSLRSAYSLSSNTDQDTPPAGALPQTGVSHSATSVINSSHGNQITESNDFTESSAPTFVYPFMTSCSPSNINTSVNVSGLRISTSQDTHCRHPQNLSGCPYRVVSAMVSTSSVPTTPEHFSAPLNLLIPKSNSSDIPLHSGPFENRKELPLEDNHHIPEPHTNQPCAHTPEWKSLRVKKGISHMLCLSCGAKWKAKREFQPK